MTTALPDAEIDQSAATAPGVPWVCIVWDDPVNTMMYVAYVFSHYFGYPKAEAERLMLLVHTTGKAVVSSGEREKIEVDTSAMHSYGLWATMQREDQP